MANIPTYSAARKRGDEAARISCIRCWKPILAPTYGVITYQEQVHAGCASRLPAIRWRKADLLRRAMGKKIKAEMDAQRAGFVKGCADLNGIDARHANELFDLIDKFAGYGFTRATPAPMRCSPTRPRG